MAGSEIVREIKRLEEQLKIAESERAKLDEQIALIKERRDQLRAKFSVDSSESELNEDEDEDWDVKTFPWSAEVDKILQNTFKLKEFRLNQLEAINATLSKKDVIVVMPTGAGKSLCYQLPALVEKGITLVVSPLISLIEDQLIALHKLDISAETLNSTTPKEKRRAVYEYMCKRTGTEIKLLYVTPEWIAKSKTFMSQLQKCHILGNLDRIVIDEIHCCSQWGHDFRKDYKFLGLLKGMFCKVPFLGLTATATRCILIDVQEMLNLEKAKIMLSTFDRPNLYYEVLGKPDSMADCLEYLEKLLKTEFKGQSGIIYTFSIKDSESLALGLRRKGLKVHYYHANMEADDRSKVHRRWLVNHYQVIIATVAFGMGIDKPDVRFVIHYSIPKSIEGFYQESGRAGRDGKPARCMLLYRLADYFSVNSSVKSRREEEKLKEILFFCLNQNKCRHRQIGYHFDVVDEKEHCNKMCDNCNKDSKYYEYDISSACKAIFAILKNAERKKINMTLLKLLDAWFETGSRDLRVETIKKPSISRETAEYIIAYLITKGFIKEVKSFTAYNVYIYLEVTTNETHVVMPLKHALRGFPRTEKNPNDVAEQPAKRMKI